MNNTKIQWCDGTVSPVPTCDGCPLRLPEAAVRREIRHRLCDERIAVASIEAANQAYLVSGENSRRQRILAAIGQALPANEPKRKERVEQLTREVYKTTSSCYAGVLTDNRGGKVRGYAERFEQTTLFSGRTEAAARVLPPCNLRRPDKPWLNGCRRLWFVNDMGDALSNDVPFEFLQKEIVEVAASANGQRSVWLWLTKRPKRMADFAR